MGSVSWSVQPAGCMRDQEVVSRQEQAVGAGCRHQLVGTMLASASSCSLQAGAADHWMFAHAAWPSAGRRLPGARPAPTRVGTFATQYTVPTTDFRVTVMHQQIKMLCLGNIPARFLGQNRHLESITSFKLLPVFPSFFITPSSSPYQYNVITPLLHIITVIMIIPVAALLLIIISVIMQSQVITYVTM